MVALNIVLIQVRTDTKDSGAFYYEEILYFIDFYCNIRRALNIAKESVLIKKLLPTT